MLYMAAMPMGDQKIINVLRQRTSSGIQNYNKLTCILKNGAMSSNSIDVHWAMGKKRVGRIKLKMRNFSSNVRMVLK